MKTQYVIVLVTTQNKQEAETMAQSLLKQKLIACANILGPMTSHFYWSDKIEKAEEFLLLMKSQLNMFDKIAAAVNKLHSYDVPEVLALPIMVGSEAYLSWLDRSLMK